MNIGFPRNRVGEKTSEPLKFEITVQPGKNVYRDGSGHIEIFEQTKVNEEASAKYKDHDKDDEKCHDIDDEKCHDKDDKKCHDKDDEKCHDKDDEKCHDKDDEKCHDKDDEKCHDKDDEKCHDKDDEKCHDKDDEKCHDKDDEKCHDKDDKKCHDKDDEKCHDKDDEKCHDKDDEKCHDKDDEKCHDKDDEKCHDKDDEKCHDKDDEKCHDKDERAKTACVEKYCKSDIITVKSCDDLVCYDLGEYDFKQNGFILQLSIKLKDVCPNRRTALAVILYELDKCDKECLRGFKTILLPPTGRCFCGDICVNCIHFVVPAALDISGDCCPCGPRRFFVRYTINYVDSDFSPCGCDKY